MPRYLVIVGLVFCSWIPPLLASTYQVHEFKLENGLKLIVKEDHRAPIVVSQVWYKIGNSYENEGKTGLSHLLEHMMFKGTQKYPAGEFSRIMDVQGATENAFTGSDYTAYFQTLEKTRLPISFELEADRMRNLVLTEAEFVKERAVVVEERSTRTEDNPSNFFYEQFSATAYQISPYRNPIIGWMSDIENMKLSDLQHWYEQWYAPNNAIVVVVGDVDPQAVLELATQHFGPLKPSQLTPPVHRPEPEQQGIKRITVKRPAKLPSLLMGYKVPALPHIPSGQEWEVYALEVLSYLLDGGDSARLNRYLVRDQQVASFISAGYDSGERLPSLFTFSATPAEGKTIEQVEKSLREQIALLQTQLVKPEELARVKTLLRASEVYERDSLFYQGMKIGLLETSGLSWSLSEQYLTRIAEVTAEQIQTVAQKYLIDDFLTVGILEPLPLTTESKSPPSKPKAAAGETHS